MPLIVDPNERTCSQSNRKKREREREREVGREETKIERGESSVEKDIWLFNHC